MVQASTFVDTGIPYYTIKFYDAARRLLGQVVIEICCIEDKKLCIYVIVCPYVVSLEINMLTFKRFVSVEVAFCVPRLKYYYHNYLCQVSCCPPLLCIIYREHSGTNFSYNEPRCEQWSQTGRRLTLPIRIYSIIHWTD